MSPLMICPVYFRFSPPFPGHFIKPKLVTTPLLNEIDDSDICVIYHLYLVNPLRLENGVEHPFIGPSEKVQHTPEHPKMLRFQVGQKVLLGIPFFKKNDSLFILDTPAEVAVEMSTEN